jgi:hypothetical protein
MDHHAVVALLRRDVTPELYGRIRELWKAHSIAEDRRDVAGLLSTLTDDCLYEIAGTGAAWRGHEGAARFYGELLTAFPDIRFSLRGIVIGPQGVCEEAHVTATHQAAWLGAPPSRQPVAFDVVIFFPWDPERSLFSGERIVIQGGPAAAGLGVL